jgi:FkbM family methyltransferase
MRCILKRWVIGFFLQYHRFFSFRSLMIYRKVLINERKGLMGYGDQVMLRMKWPIQQYIRIRPMSNDHYTFIEVFVDEVYGALCHYAKDAKSIVDLGANIGLASLYMMRQYPGARLLAVEPDPSNFKLLLQNLEASQFCDRSRAIQAAVWSDSGPLEIHQPESAGHVNQYRVKPVESTGEKCGAIPGMTIQKIFEMSGFDSIDILKVDVEGAEVELFKGNTDWLKRVRWLAIEFHDESRKQCDFDALMARQGWKILDETSHTVVAGRT